MKELKDTLKQSSEQEALSVKKQVIDRMQRLTEKCNKLSFEPLQNCYSQVCA